MGPKNEHFKATSAISPLIKRIYTVICNRKVDNDGSESEFEKNEVVEPSRNKKKGRNIPGSGVSCRDDEGNEYEIQGQADQLKTETMN